jgi:(p)ppGpp synthase/HD superfamily hydrolase
MMQSERFGFALAYAASLHRDQRRKGTDIPYIGHLLAVAALVIEDGGDETAAIAALLHDAVEDQGGPPRAEDIGKLFGPEVRAIVMDCTDSVTDPKPAWRDRKERYVAAIAKKPVASLRVSVADKLHNATAIERDLAAIGPALWERFRGGRDGTLWYYRALADAFLASLPNSALAQALDAAVTRIERAA